ILVRLHEDAAVTGLDFTVRATLVPGESRVEDGLYVFRLAAPLKPGEKAALNFKMELWEKGFKNHNFNNRLTYNGSFLVDHHLIPVVGYNMFGELVNNDKRKKYGLPRRERFPSVHNEDARQNTYISQCSDWISYEAVVSTCSDQVVLSPGQLVKQWSKGDRRYFHYKTRHKILKFFPVVSGRFLVKTDSWKDVDIEVYYQEGHEYNIERIINAVKKSLDYMTAN
ncbi:MAG: M1 family metallopeptidase, partial [bacterium]|nr:M1 family metallopeptidase [bacterium]